MRKKKNRYFQVILYLPSVFVDLAVCTPLAFTPRENKSILELFAFALAVESFFSWIPSLSIEFLLMMMFLLLFFLLSIECPLKLLLDLVKSSSCSLHLEVASLLPEVFSKTSSSNEFNLFTEILFSNILSTERVLVLVAEIGLILLLSAVLFLI